MFINLSIFIYEWPEMNIGKVARTLVSPVIVVSGDFFFFW